jgi:hypothetical protein
MGDEPDSWLHNWLEPTMEDNRAPREKRQQDGNAGKDKKLYQKPAFRYERVFETLALSCGKTIGSTAVGCQVSRKTS